MDTSGKVRSRVFSLQQLIMYYDARQLKWFLLGTLTSLEFIALVFVG